MGLDRMKLMLLDIGLLAISKNAFAVCNGRMSWGEPNSLLLDKEYIYIYFAYISH